VICPGCQQDVEPRPVGFTWWGGMFGAKLFNHCECPSCRARFNGRTGRSNTTAIAIYMVATGALAMFVVYAVMHR
jgi:hypothetical protein